jgi:cell division protein ZapA
MAEIQIRIKIIDKEYSLKATDPKDELLLRQAAKLLNERVKNIQKNSGVLDKQDLLSMVAFDYAVQLLRQTQGLQQQGTQLDRLTALVDEALGN